MLMQGMSGTKGTCASYSLRYSTVLEYFNQFVWKPPPPLKRTLNDSSLLD